MQKFELKVIPKQTFFVKKYPTKNKELIWPLILRTKDMIVSEKDLADYSFVQFDSQTDTSEFYQALKENTTLKRVRSSIKTIEETHILSYTNNIVYKTTDKDYDDLFEYLDHNAYHISGKVREVYNTITDEIELQVPYTP